MLRNLTLGLLLLATPAYADHEALNDPAPCGKTPVECQKVVDSQAKSISQLTEAYKIVVQQRNNAYANQADMEVNNYIQNMNKTVDNPKK